MKAVQEKIENSVPTLKVGDATPPSDYLWLKTAIVLIKQRRLIAEVTCAAAVLSFVVSLLLPVQYTARSRILPPKENNSAAAFIMGSQLGALASLTGASGGLLKDPNDMYVSMIGSRTITDAFVEKFGLMKRYRAKTRTEAEDKLATFTKISSGADSIITVEVTDRDPVIAAAIANSYIDGFSGLTLELLNQSASRRRVFMQDQLEKAKRGLSQSEADLKSMEEKTGMITLTDQTRAIIEGVARLRAEIAAREVRLESMRSFATPENPDVIREETALKTMRAQLATMESSGSLGAGNVLLPTSKVPSVGLTYIDRLRDVRYSEAMVELLSKQYEIALLDESNSATAVQILERASVPEKKSKPKRSLIVFLSTITGALLGITLAFFREHLEEVASDPEGYALLQQIKAMLSRNRSRLEESSSFKN